MRSSQTIKLNFGTPLCCFLLQLGKSGGTDSQQNALKHFAVWTFFHYLFVVFYFWLTVCQNPFYLERCPLRLVPCFFVFFKHPGKHTHSHKHTLTQMKTTDELKTNVKDKSF